MIRALIKVFFQTSHGPPEVSEQATDTCPEGAEIVSIDVSKGLVGIDKNPRLFINADSVTSADKPSVAPITID